MIPSVTLVPNLIDINLIDKIMPWSSAFIPLTRSKRMNETRASHLLRSNYIFHLLLHALDGNVLGKGKKYGDPDAPTYD